MAVNLGRIVPKNKGQYDATVTYEELDNVTYNDILFACKKTCTGITPVDGEFWQRCTPDFSTKANTDGTNATGTWGINIKGNSNVSLSLDTKGPNTISSVEDDTPDNWYIQKNSVHWYNSGGMIKNQPSQYGFVMNSAVSSSDVHQLWLESNGDPNSVAAIYYIDLDGGLVGLVSGKDF